jgi:ABC-type transporter Mla subunit MlaD
VAESLDAELRDRIWAVLNRQPVTEVELRKLTEEGRARALMLGARLERSERLLGELSSDSASSLAEIAAALRDVNASSSELGELEQLLRALGRRARAFRTAWLSGSE